MTAGSAASSRGRRRGRGGAGRAARGSGGHRCRAPSPRRRRSPRSCPGRRARARRRGRPTASGAVEGQRLVEPGQRPGRARGTVGRRPEPAVALGLLLLGGRRRGPAALALELARRADLGPQLLELGPHACQLGLGLRERPLPLGGRRRAHLLDLVLEPFGGALRLQARRLRLLLLGGRGRERLLRLAGRGLGLGDELGDEQPLGRDALPRGRDDRRRQAEALRGLQRVRRAGPAEDDRVERLVALGVDAGGGVRRAVGGARPLLQLGEVARRHGQPRLRGEAARAAPRRAPRPRPGSVPAASSSRRTSDSLGRPLEDPDEVAHVRGEGREAHRDRLLVADVDEDLVEDRQRRLVGGRPQPALVERRGEAERLQGDGLAARVRPADHERPQRAELEVDRDGRCPCRAAGAAHRAGRPSWLSVTSAPRHARERLPRASARSSSAVARTSVVSSSACAATSEERLRRIRATSSRSATSASRSRLESSTAASGSTKSVWPGAGRVVHDPGHASARRRLQREHGAAAALGHEVVLQVLGEGRVARDLAEALGQLAAALAELAAQPAQRGRGRVLEVGAVLLDRAADLLGDREQRRLDGRRRGRRSAGRSSRVVDRAARRQRPRGSCARSATRLRVSSVLPRAARSAASLTSAAPPRSGSAASSSRAIASVVCCWRRRTSSASAEGRRASARALPGRSPPLRRAGSGRRGARAARGRARAWGECTAVLVSRCDGPERRTTPSCRSRRLVRYRSSLPQLNGNVLLTDGGWRRP